MKKIIILLFFLSIITNRLFAQEKNHVLNLNDFLSMSIEELLNTQLLISSLDDQYLVITEINDDELKGDCPLNINDVIFSSNQDNFPIDKILILQNKDLVYFPTDAKGYITGLESKKIKKIQLLQTKNSNETWQVINISSY